LCLCVQLNEALEELEQEKGKELAALHAALDNHRRIADQARITARIPGPVMRDWSRGYPGLTGRVDTRA
jgi:hypothetical protein